LTASLADFTAHLLTERGGVVEPSGDGLEVLLPAETALALEIPEHANLAFSGDGSDGIAVSYDSDFLRKMARLIGQRGRFSTVSLAPSPVRIEKLADRLDEKIAFHNAVFDLERTEEKRVSYLLGYSKYSALSDDRQEGILGSMVNELNLTVRKASSETFDFIAGNAEKPTGEVERNSSESVLQAFWRSQTEMVKEGLQDFLTSVERRMNRDIRRVHDYYQTLVHEHRQLLAKKLATPEEQEKTLSKIEAVERELKSKILDLVGKFSLEIQLEPISFLRVEAMSPILWLSVKRRKDARQFPLTYNPITKSLDPLPCEACFYPKKGYYVCDDRLHILCRRCFSPCPRCEKFSCAACHPKGCPKCATVAAAQAH
jgi:hypothetical protein